MPSGTKKDETKLSEKAMTDPSRLAEIDAEVLELLGHYMACKRYNERHNRDVGRLHDLHDEKTAIARRFEERADKAEADMKINWEQSQAAWHRQERDIKTLRERAERAEVDMEWRRKDYEALDLIRLKVIGERDVAEAMVRNVARERDAARADKETFRKDYYAPLVDANVNLQSSNERLRADLARLREALENAEGALEEISGMLASPRITAKGKVVGEIPYTLKRWRAKKAALAGDGETDLERELKTTPEIAPAKPAPSGPCRGEVMCVVHLRPWNDCYYGKPPAPCPGAEMEVDKSDLLKPNIVFVKAGHCPSCKGA